MRSLRRAAAAAGLGLLLAACGADAPAPKPKAKAKAEQEEKAVPAAEAVTAPAQAEAESFVYEPAGLRDPFQPFVKVVEKSKKKEAKPKVFVPKTPLQRYAVEELRVVGVIWADGRNSKALIEDPEGKGYVVRAGTLVGDMGGRIVGIRPDRLVVEERFVDILGEENVKVVELTLRKPEDEVKR